MGKTCGVGSSVDGLSIGSRRKYYGETEMSKWYTVAEEDIEIDLRDETVDMFVCSDNDGSIYLSLSFDQMKALADRVRR